jgi:hypothetical protein
MNGSCSSRRIRRRESTRPASSASRRPPGVLVVIVYRDLDGDLHGMNAWPASGRDLTTYLKEW